MSVLRGVPVALLVLLTGCGQVANIRSLSTGYVAPTSGETARVRLITDGLVRAVPGRDCLDWNVPGAGVMASTKAGFPDHNAENRGIPGPTYPWAGAVTAAAVVPADDPRPLQ